MKTVRVIPRLDIKGPNLVKGIQFEGLRVLGKPEAFANWYYEQGADELIYLDVVASLYDRNSLIPFVEKTAKEIFIPLTVGGGLRNLDDIREILRAGADKVYINTQALLDSDFIRKAANEFGSSTIVAGIEARKSLDGNYEALFNYGHDGSGVNAQEWAEQVENLGAGEILLTSIDRDGTQQGCDIDLVKKVSSTTSIPIIAGGGCGNVDDISKVITEGGASAIHIASLLHYKAIEQMFFSENEYIEGNTDFLNSGVNSWVDFKGEISQIKRSLIEKGLACRV